MTAAPRLNCNLFLLSGSFEEQWFLHCLSELQPRIFRAYRDTWHQIAEYDERNALDIYYTNPTNQEGRDALAAVRAARKPELGHGLLIGGDENFLTSPRLYHGARFVIRTYLAAFYPHPRIFTLPEGPFYRPQPSTKQLSNPKAPISVFFSGQIKYSRVAMAKAFHNHPDAYIKDPADKNLPSEDYLAKLTSARFALCPNGNTTPDTLRLYEALEAGVIPIAEKSYFYDYLGALFGGCPIPRFSRWSQARRFTSSLSAQETMRLREDISSWWSSEKKRLPCDLLQFVEVSLRSDSSNFRVPGRWDSISYRVKALAYLAIICSPSGLLIRLRNLLLKSIGRLGRRT